MHAEERKGPHQTRSCLKQPKAQGAKENPTLMKRASAKSSVQVTKTRQPPIAQARKPLQSSLYENAVSSKQKAVTTNSDLDLNYQKPAPHPKKVTMGQSAINLQQHRKSIH